MRAVLCVDLEPDSRTPPTGVPVEWAGAELLLSDGSWLRRLLTTPVLNWFVRVDRQIEELHGRDTWAAEHFADRFEVLLERGDEVGVHPHNWRLIEGRWKTDGSDEWAVDNAGRSLAGFEKVFGCPPPSFRYGDRFVSDAVVRLLLDHPGVRVDLTTEPGAPACLSLVGGDFGRGVTRHVDQSLSARYRPSRHAADIPAECGSLTAVPLTSAVVQSTGSIDTLYLWRQPEEFERMARLRALDRDLDHLAFAIRSDMQLNPWAIEHVEQNLQVVHAVFGDIEWVRASELALGHHAQPASTPGIVGSIVSELEAVRDDLAAAHIDVERVSGDLAGARSQLEELRRNVADQQHRAEVAESAADRLDEELAAIRRTAWWRSHQRLLPILQPVARLRRAVRRGS